MRHRDPRTARLHRADFTAAPLPLWRSGAEWQRRPMPLWRELLDAILCLLRRMGPQRITPLPSESSRKGGQT